LQATLRTLVSIPRGGGPAPPLAHKSVQRHCLRRIFDRMDRRQASVRAQWIVSGAMAARGADDTMIVALDDAIEQAHGPRMRDARGDPAVVADHVESSSASCVSGR
jgi:hypothetical protein